MKLFRKKSLQKSKRFLDKDLRVFQLPDFEIEGGIWNFNNLNQKENPIWTRKFYGGDYQGYGMFFYNVKNFRISNLTLF